MRTQRRTTGPAIATAIWAILFEGLNIYWSLGGRWLTDHLGISIQESIAENDQQLMIANIVGGIGKLVLGVNVVLTILPAGRAIPRWFMTLATLGAGILLALYGLANWTIVSIAMLGWIDMPSSIGKGAVSLVFLAVGAAMDYWRDLARPHLAGMAKESLRDLASKQDPDFPNEIIRSETGSAHVPLRFPLPDPVVARW